MMVLGVFGSFFSSSVEILHVLEDDWEGLLSTGLGDERMEASPVVLIHKTEVEIFLQKH